MTFSMQRTIARSQLRPFGTKRVSVIRAAAPGEPKDATRSLDFAPTNQSSDGFIQEDSAGQTNMFPTVAKAYESGSSSDDTAAGEATNSVAAAGAVIAAVAVALGLLALKGTGAGVAEPTGEYRTLSEYKAIFEKEL